jgi:hypothetical protein
MSKHETPQAQEITAKWNADSVVYSCRVTCVKGIGA